MPHILTRQELYDLAWSEPMQNLAKRFSISDRGLAKICAAANIPVPPRGYWAKLQAGRKAQRWALPARGLGQSERVRIGQSAWPQPDEFDADIMKAPIPPRPVFEPDMDAVRAQVAALVQRAPLPLRDSHGWHSQVAKLLAADEARLRKQQESPYPMSWDGPVFNTAFEQRRLRILNALFICVTRCGMHPQAGGKHGRDLSITVGDTAVPFQLDAVGAEKHIERERQGYGFQARGDKDMMRLWIAPWWSERLPDGSWADKPGQRLEQQLREIAAAIIVLGEQRLRDNAASAHQRRIQRKAELIEAERKRKAEEERRRQERLAKLEQARIDHLLGQANALHQAEQIRAYVRAVQEMNVRAPEPMSAEELQEWAGWALAQADRIDPVLSGAYKTRPAEADTR